MTATYVLINGVSAPFFSFGMIVPPITDGPIPRLEIGGKQSFQLTVTGQSGAAVSSTAQVYVSNDGKNWAPYFDPIEAGGTTTATAGFGGSQPWNYFTALLTAISGTNAEATLLMNG